MSVIPLSPPCSKSNPGPWAQTPGLQTAELWNWLQSSWTCEVHSAQTWAAALESVEIFFPILQTSFLHRTIGVLTLGVHHLAVCAVRNSLIHLILPFRCTVLCAYVVKSRHEGFECIFTEFRWSRTFHRLWPRLCFLHLRLHSLCHTVQDVPPEWRISFIVFETSVGSVGSHLFKTLFYWQ